MTHIAFVRVTMLDECDLVFRTLLDVFLTDIPTEFYGELPNPLTIFASKQIKVWLNNNRKLR